MRQPLIALYSAAKRSGFLRTRAGDALFNRSYFAYKRLIEDPFAKLIRAEPELFRGGHILDAGANIGYTTVLFARAVAEPYRVIAFEPEEENFLRLQRNVRRYGAWRRAELVRAAVGDCDGTILLWRNETHHGDHRVMTPAFAAGHSGVEVPVTRLDSYVHEPVAFVKIDVQGFEPAVIAGMTRLIDVNPRLTIAVEVCPQALADLGFHASDIARPLEERGFVPRRISDRRDYYDLIWRRP